MNFNFIALVFGVLAAASRAACPCEDASLCAPIRATYAHEVFGFGGGDYTTYDWSVVTTVAWASDPQLMCKAHKEGARVVAAAPGGMPLSGNKTERSIWIQKAIAQVKSTYFDGITFDYEDPLPVGDPRVAYYTALVAETTAAFHDAIPGSQVSVCVAWSPDNIDGRAYDYTGLSNASDFLYVMMYDTRSQIFDRCIASANAALSTVNRGIGRYIDIGIPPKKMVLGVPWYGYTYPCIGHVSDDSSYCPIAEVPFRGVNCSDAAGGEIEYFRIMALLDENKTLTPRLWDSSVQSPYFNYRAQDGSIHQMWYDDPESLALKYKAAVDFGLLGVGPFTFDDLDPTGAKSGNPMAAAETAAMWKAISVYGPKKSVN